MKKIVLAMSSLIFCLAANAEAITWSNQTQDTVQVIEVGGTGRDGSIRGYAINDIGQVTGYYDTLAYPGEQHAFVWSLATNAMVDIGTLGGGQSWGVAINNFGQVTGNARVLGDIGLPAQQHAFLWDPNTNTMADLGTLGGEHSYGASINDAGQVVGCSSVNANSASDQAFIWNPITNSMTSLGGQVGYWGKGESINNNGQVVGTVGSSATLWDASSGMVIKLGSLGSNLGSEDINNKGQVTGVSSMSGGLESHAFVWDQESGMMTDLGTLGGNHSHGFSINDLGQVTGYASIDDSGDLHAFVYENGMMYDLNTMVNLAAGEYLQTSSINNLSQIVATSTLGKTYVLTPSSTSSPVPIPSSILLLGTGICFLANRLR